MPIVSFKVRKMQHLQYLFLEFEWHYEYIICLNIPVYINVANIKLHPFIQLWKSNWEVIKESKETKVRPEFLFCVCMPLTLLRNQNVTHNIIPRINIWKKEYLQKYESFSFGRKFSLGSHNESHFSSWCSIFCWIPFNLIYFKYLAFQKALNHTTSRYIQTYHIMYTNKYNFKFKLSLNY